MYQAAKNLNQFGQWVSPTKKFVFGCNNGNSIGSDLYMGGYITKQMYLDWDSNHTYAASEIAFYFIDVENRKIAFFYRHNGCIYTKMTPGFIGRQLVEGYNSIQEI